MAVLPTVTAVLPTVTAVLPTVTGSPPATSEPCHAVSQDPPRAEGIWV